MERRAKVTIVSEGLLRCPSYRRRVGQQPLLARVQIQIKFVVVVERGLKARGYVLDSGVMRSGNTLLIPNRSVFGFSFRQNRNIRVRIFPECKEFLVGGLRLRRISSHRPS